MKWRHAIPLICEFAVVIFHRPAKSTIEGESDEEDEEDEEAEEFAFPELDSRIREVVREYGAVFPKLNFSSPRVRFLFFLAPYTLL